MKFTKREDNGTIFWDSPSIGDNQYLRIKIHFCGGYALYHCTGLAENGVTPLKMDHLAKRRTFTECKKKAEELYEKPKQAVVANRVGNYSDVRLPYKD